LKRAERAGAGIDLSALGPLALRVAHLLEQEAESLDEIVNQFTGARLGDDLNGPPTWHRGREGDHG
jgi:hypothetical protein